MTALEKRPARRYPSAAAFAADLRAFLDGDPVVARAPGALTLLARSARRRPALAVASALALVLAVGGPLQLWRTNRRIQAALASEEQQRHFAEDSAAAAQAALAETQSAQARAEAALADAQAERERAQAADDRVERARRSSRLVDEFLYGLLVTPDDRRDDATATVGEVLDRAEAGLRPVFESDLDLLVTIRVSVAKAAAGLGRYEQALRLLETAWTESQPLEGAHADVLRFEIRRSGSVVLLRQERYPEAEVWSREAVDLARVPPGAPVEDLYGVQSQLAQALDKQGQRADARALYGEVLEKRRADPTTNPEFLAQSINNYASVLGPERHDEAAALFKEALAIQATIAPADDYQAAKMLHNRLWIGFYEIEPTADDIAALRRGLDVVRARAGPTAQFTASMSMLLGKLLQRVEGSDPAEIEALLHASAEAFEPAGGRQSAALMWSGGSATWAGSTRRSPPSSGAKRCAQRSRAATRARSGPRRSGPPCYASWAATPRPTRCSPSTPGRSS